MKLDALTYQAGEIDLSLASAPAISGRSDISGEAVSALAARLWVMLSFQIMAYFAKVKTLSPKAELVMRYGEPSTRLISVTMNRRLRRKLRKFQQIGRIKAPELCIHDPMEEDALTRGQLLDRMIRTQKWCRMRVFGLGQSRRERQLHVMRFLGWQGSLAHLQCAMSCHAPLCPD